MERDMSKMIKKMDRARDMLQEKSEMLNDIVREVAMQAAEIKDSQNFLDELHMEIRQLRTGQRTETQNGGRLIVGLISPLPGSF
jgi:uncharacterized coiled-coil DUF342 family protein